MEVGERLWTVKDERMQSANRMQSEYVNIYGERMVNAWKNVKVERFRDCMKSVSIICITSTSKYKCLILFSLWTAGLRSLEEICPSVVSYWAGIYVSISALPSSHSSPEPPWQPRGVTTSHSLPPKDCRTPSQFKPKGEEGIIIYCTCLLYWQFLSTFSSPLQASWYICINSWIGLTHLTKLSTKYMCKSKEIYW